MSVSIYFGFKNSDEFVSVNAGRNFLEEILGAKYPDYFNLDAFLTNEEQKLLFPDYDENEYSRRHIDPAKLKDVFVKVYDYLKVNHDNFPLTHYITDEKNKYLYDKTDIFDYKGYKCYLDASHQNLNHREELCLFYWQEEWKVLEWIKVSKKLIVGNNVYYIETQNKFDQFKYILEELIKVCDDGIKNNKKLLWLFST